MNTFPISNTSALTPLLLTDKELAQKLGVCKSYVRRLAKSNPLFPQPLKLSRKVTRFRVSDLEQYIRSLD